MHDDLLLEALVDQGFLDGFDGVLGDLVQQCDARGVVVRVRGEDDHRDDQAQHVHGQSTLTAGHPLGRIEAGRGGREPGGRMDTPGVQHYQGRVL